MGWISLTVFQYFCSCTRKTYLSIIDFRAIHIRVAFLLGTSTTSPQENHDRDVLDTDGHQYIFSYVGYVKLDEDQLYIKHRYKFRFLD